MQYIIYADKVIYKRHWEEKLIESFNRIYKGLGCTFFADSDSASNTYFIKVEGEISQDTADSLKQSVSVYNDGRFFGECYMKDAMDASDRHLPY